MKTAKSIENVLPMFSICSSHGNSMNNLLAYCGLIVAKIRASDKVLPVYKFHFHPAVECNLDANEATKFEIQVNLCQKYLFTHQLTHNMTTDCSMISKFSTRKLQE